MWTAPARRRTASASAPKRSSQRDRPGQRLGYVRGSKPGLKWLWVKHRATPRWLTLLNGLKDETNQRSNSWWLNFDPCPDLGQWSGAAAEDSEPDLQVSTLKGLAERIAS